jgi:hypothetical protein
MMKKILDFLFRIFVKPLTFSFKRFYEAIIYGFSLGLLMILALDVLEGVVWISDLQSGMYLSIPLMIVVALIYERFPSFTFPRWGASIGVVLFTIVYFIYARNEASSAVLFLRFSNLGYAFYLLPLIFPFLFHSNNIEYFIVMVITKFFSAVFYTIVLYLGIAVILLSMDVLFQINITLTTYTSFFIAVIAYVFLPVFLSSYPNPDHNLTLKDFSVIWQRVFTWVIAPVIAVFSGLILLYLVTGLFQSETYQSGIYTFSTLVIAFAGIASQFALKSFTKLSSFHALFVKYFHIVLFFIMVGYYIELIRSAFLVGFWLSIVVQLILGIWPIVYSITKFKQHQQSDHIGLTALLSAFLVISVVPIVNAVSISTFALTIQLDQTLIKHNMLSEDRQSIIPNDNLNLAEYEQLLSIVAAMDEIGLSRFPRIPADFEFPFSFEAIFGQAPNGDNPNDEVEFLSYQLNSPVILLPFLIDQDYVIYVQSLQELTSAGGSFAFDTYTLNYLAQSELKQYSLSLVEDEVIWQQNLYTIAKDFQTKFNTDFYLSNDVEEMTVSVNLATMDVQLVILSLSSSASIERAQFNNLSMEFYFTIKLK